jgi:hypothetical protein
MKENIGVEFRRVPPPPFIRVKILFLNSSAAGPCIKRAESWAVYVTSPKAAIGWVASLRNPKVPGSALDPETGYRDLKQFVVVFLSPSNETQG